MNTIVKKLFKHGGSSAVDLPREFVKGLGSNTEVVLHVESNRIRLQPKSRLDTLESEPEFASFLQALTEDAMKHPQKLSHAKNVWYK